MSNWAQRFGMLPIAGDPTFGFVSVRGDSVPGSGLGATNPFAQLLLPYRQRQAMAASGETLSASAIRGQSSGSSTAIMNAIAFSKDASEGGSVPQAAKLEATWPKLLAAAAGIVIGLAVVKFVVSR